MQRDKRWENVWASIGPVPISGSDLETGFHKTLEKLVEIRIHVPYGVRIYTSVHRVSKEQLEEFRGDLLSLILDRMVANIDDMLNKEIMMEDEDWRPLSENVRSHAMLGWMTHEDGRVCAYHVRLGAWTFDGEKECLRSHPKPYE